MYGSILKIIESLKVGQIIMGKQFESSDNYEEVMNLVKDKNIETHVIESGQKINIEKNLYIDVLWPSKNQISENSLNNNSLICKLNYNNFSMLFTGDIEKVAEEKILNNIDNDLLNVDILKVAHHGSKTSSTEEFIKAVKPRIALIGVGKNNKFGHPNEDVLNRLSNYGTKIYRTDENGEISIMIDRKGVISVESLLNKNNIKR